MWERKKERHNECAISSKKGSSQTVKMHNNKKKILKSLHAQNEIWQGGWGNNSIGNISHLSHWNILTSENRRNLTTSKKNFKRNKQLGNRNKIQFWNHLLKYCE